MSLPAEQLAARHEIEETYHDRVAHGQPEDFWSFSALDAPDAYLWKTLGDLRGKSVLELGCGDGDTTVKLARAGARVTAIDISGEMCALAQQRADACGLGHSVTTVHTSAEAMDFPENSFDVVYGHSVVHHLEQPIAIPKIARLLKPGGHASFLEPLDHNPILNLARRLTPDMRTPTEKPVSLHEIDEMSAQFSKTSRREFHLIALGAYFWFYVVRNRAMFDRTLRVFVPVDRALFLVAPFLRRYAWVTVLTFKK